MKYVLILLLVFATQTAGAQSIKELLARKKQEAKDKLETKADQKGSQAIDSAIAAPGTVARKVKDKKAKKKAASANDTVAEVESGVALQPDPVPEELAGSQLLIETNILCEAGRTKMEARLRKQPAVLEVSVDPGTGDLSIRYKPGSLDYATLIQMINNAGFTADDKKPAPSAPVNPCAGKR